MDAAIKVIAAQGLSAPTALIAKEAGVSSGSLFTYFATKADLLNQLYLELKTEMAAVALAGLPKGSELREQMFHMWSNWMNLAIAKPDKRRALAHLVVSDEITSATRATAHKTMGDVAVLLERSRANGPMRNASMTFVVAILNSLADATMDFMIHDPANAKKHCKTGFEAFWRVIG